MASLVAGRKGHTSDGPRSEAGLARALGGRVRWHTFASPEHWHPSDDLSSGNWTPDGNYFVFLSERVPNTKNLYALDERTSFLHKRNFEPTQLTSGPTLIQGAVASRNGKKLFAIGGGPLGELLRYDAASRQFQPFLNGVSAIQLSFTKDGQWVAYMSYPDGILWRSKKDGSERQQLTFLPMTVLAPQMSPDGKQIAFAGQLPGKPAHIYTISVDGGTPHEMTNGDRDEVYPSWSPDGNTIFFGNPADPSFAPAIHRLDLKTGEIATLKNSESTRGPRISPDGNFLVALSDANRLVLFNLKDGGRSELTNIAGFHPAWSRDGKYVYFNSAAQGEPAIYRVQVKGHGMERVVSLKDVKRPTSQSWGSWTGLGPDGSPLALRDISTYEIYALDWQAP